MELHCVLYAELMGKSLEATAFRAIPDEIETRADRRSPEMCEDIDGTPGSLLLLESPNEEKPDRVAERLLGRRPTALFKLRLREARVKKRTHMRRLVWPLAIHRYDTSRSAGEKPPPLKPIRPRFAPIRLPVARILDPALHPPANERQKRQGDQTDARRT